MIRPKKLWLSCRAKCWGRTRLILKKLKKVVLSHNNSLTPAHSVRRLFTGLALADGRVDLQTSERQPFGVRCNPGPCQKPRRQSHQGVAVRRIHLTGLLHRPKYT